MNKNHNKKSLNNFNLHVNKPPINSIEKIGIVIIY